MGEPRTKIECQIARRAGSRQNQPHFQLFRFEEPFPQNQPYQRSQDRFSASWSASIIAAIAQHAQKSRLQRSLEDACYIAKLCEEYRGKDTVVLDLTAVTPIMDFFVISTGANARQMHALADEVRMQMKARGNKAPGTEGYEQSSWILQDWGDIVLHLFLPDARDLYDLEGLWGDAKRVDWKSIANGS